MGSTIAAISATACKAQCVELSERASPLVLQTFAADPGWLLRDLRNKREDLTPRLTGYLVSDISVLPAVRTLASEAPNADRPAIGAALRRAEARCLRSSRKPPTISTNLFEHWKTIRLFPVTRPRSTLRGNYQ